MLEPQELVRLCPTISAKANSLGIDMVMIFSDVDVKQNMVQGFIVSGYDDKPIKADNIIELRSFLQEIFNDVGISVYQMQGMEPSSNQIHKAWLDTAIPIEAVVANETFVEQFEKQKAISIAEQTDCPEEEHTATTPIPERKRDSLEQNPDTQPKRQKVMPTSSHELSVIGVLMAPNDPEILKRIIQVLHQKIEGKLGSQETLLLEQSIIRDVPQLSQQPGMVAGR